MFCSLCDLGLNSFLVQENIRLLVNLKFAIEYGKDTFSLRKTNEYLLSLLDIGRELFIFCF